MAVRRLGEAKRRTDMSKTIKAELHVYPRLAKINIHYDRRLICHDDNETVCVGNSNCYGGYGGLYPSFDIDMAKDYILGGRNAEYFPEVLDIERLKKDIDTYRILPFKFECDVIKFYDIPFICPKSGITWRPYIENYWDHEPTEYNSHYEIKELPKRRKDFYVCEREHDAYKYVSH
jgi:hypothetical protein